MESRKGGMSVRLLIVALALFCVACSSARNERVSESNPEPTVTFTLAPNRTPAPESFPSYLLFKVGELIRLTDNGGADVMKLSIYKSLSDVEAYCQNSNGATFDKPAKQLVKVISYQDISTAQGLSEWCNPVVHVAALDGSWSGWVPQIVTAPNLPIGTKLVVKNGGLNQPNIWETPDGNHASFRVSGGTTLRYLGFDDNPGDAEYHVQVRSGSSAGKSGWTDATFLQAENGDVITMYESPEAAKIGNTPGGAEAHASPQTESQSTSTPDEGAVAQKETTTLNRYIAHYNKSISANLYRSASVDDKSATFVVDADVWNAMSSQDQRLVFNNAVHAWGELYQLNHPDEGGIELPIQFQDLSGSTVKQDIIMVGRR